MSKKIWFYTHWLLGLVAGTVLIVVGVTGAVLSFEKEIMQLINQKSYFVEVPSQERLSPEALLNAFKEKIPDARINSMTLSSDPKASALIVIQDPNATQSANGGGGRSTVTHFINPYTGEILPQVEGRVFFRWMLDLHRRLMAGQVGKQIVAASTVALIILSLTGLYLYWGSIRKSLKSSLSVNFRAKGRGFLYKLHSASALWMFPFLILVSLTGLYWSYEWYNEALYKIAGVEKPRRNLNQQQPQISQSNTQTPRSEQGTEKPLQEAERVNRSPKVPSGPSNEAIAQAWALVGNALKHPYESITLRLPTSGTKFDFTYLDEDAQHGRARNSLSVDIKEAKVVSHIRYDDKRFNEQIMSSMLPLHSGEYFGIIGRIWVFLASAGMVLFGVTGLMLYLDRRKKALKKAVWNAQKNEATRL